MPSWTEETCPGTFLKVSWRHRQMGWNMAMWDYIDPQECNWLAWSSPLTKCASFQDSWKYWAIKLGEHEKSYLTCFQLPPPDKNTQRQHDSDLAFVMYAPVMFGMTSRICYWPGISGAPSVSTYVFMFLCDCTSSFTYVFVFAWERAIIKKKGSQRTNVHSEHIWISCSKETQQISISFLKCR